MASKNVESDDVVEVYPKRSSIKFIDSDVNKMCWALTAITREIQRFHCTEKILSNKPEEIDPLIDIYKSRLQRKRKHIKRLNQNVKICWIKLLISSKEKENWKLKRNILHNRELEGNSTQDDALIRQLATRNNNFEESFENIKNHIIKGYNKIQKIMIDPPYTSGLPLLDQLKIIINECEKNNNSFCNEREKCYVLEQKNRFLQNKISILECNMESLKKELANVNYQVSKRDKEVVYYKSKLFNKINHTKFSTFESPRKDKNIISKISAHPPEINLSSHLSLVKSLLINQDRMIKKIKEMTDVILYSDK